MFEFFELISNFIDFISLFIQKVASVFNLGFRALEYLISIFTYLPTYFYLGILPLLTLLVVMMVINRGA